MRVYKYQISDIPEVLHIMAEDHEQAIKDICEEYTIEAKDIVNFIEVQKLSARRPRQ